MRMVTCASILRSSEFVYLFASWLQFWKKSQSTVLQYEFMVHNLYGALSNTWHTILPVGLPLPYTMPVDGSSIVGCHIVVDMDTCLPMAAVRSMLGVW